MSMLRIPMRALRCDVYGTVRAVVDSGHAKNVILKHGDPAASGVELYRALAILQDRIDARVAA